MRRAIIIVDHGSTREAANTMLEELADLLRARTPEPVYTAHMEVVEPTIAQAIDAAVEGGADFVFVFPYFLSPGRHSREDIPWMCAEAAARHPGLKWHCSGPIGLDPMLAELILGRVQLCELRNYTCLNCPTIGACQLPGDLPLDESDSE